MTAVLRCSGGDVRGEHGGLWGGRSGVSRLFAQRGGRGRHELDLNADGSYDQELGWGSGSTSDGTLIGSGGGISQFEPEPAYQQGVQSTGSRTIPDVALVADPATGAWIADPYNLTGQQPV